MNFLSLTSLIALLEPELAPFKDWQEISDIWEISLKVTSAPAAPAAHLAPGPLSNGAYLEKRRSWYQETLGVISMAEKISGTHLSCLRSSFLGLRNSILLNQITFRSQDLILGLTNATIVNIPPLWHLTIHSGERSNKCNPCDVASSQAIDLRVHLKTHSGEKPNKCNQC